MRTHVRVKLTITRLFLLSLSYQNFSINGSVQDQNRTEGGRGRVELEEGADQPKWSPTARFRIKTALCGWSNIQPLLF